MSIGVGEVGVADVISVGVGSFPMAHITWSKKLTRIKEIDKWICFSLLPDDGFSLVAASYERVKCEPLAKIFGLRQRS